MFKIAALALAVSVLAGCASADEMGANRYQVFPNYSTYPSAISYPNFPVYQGFSRYPDRRYWSRGRTENRQNQGDSQSGSQRSFGDAGQHAGQRDGQGNSD